MLHEILFGEFFAETLETIVYFRPALAQMRDRAIKLFFTVANVGIDGLLVSKVEGDGAIDLLQGQGREILPDRFRRITALE